MLIDSKRNAQEPEEVETLRQKSRLKKSVYLAYRLILAMVVSLDQSPCAAYKRLIE